jgi:hypothetical protein
MERCQSSCTSEHSELDSLVENDYNKLVKLVSDVKYDQLPLTDVFKALHTSLVRSVILGMEYEKGQRLVNAVKSSRNRKPDSRRESKSYNNGSSTDY